MPARLLTWVEHRTGYRKLVDRPGARSGMLAWATGWSDDAGADSVRVASRRYLGGRESVAVIHASGERFLVGITATQVSLIARLEMPGEAMADFTDALTHAAAPAADAEPVSAADHLPNPPGQKIVAGDITYSFGKLFVEIF